jgi:hypothetical protein
MKEEKISEVEKNISEGEIYIQEFFEEEGIAYEYNKNIDSLNGDNKTSTRETF